MGPLTNIAALLDVDPDIAAHVKKLVIMGGAVWCPGNVTQVAEANIWNDPHAVDRVFAADWDIAYLQRKRETKEKWKKNSFYTKT